VGQFSDFVQAVLDNGARYVVLDMTNVESVTSAGLRGIAQLGMNLAEKRGRLVAHSLRAEVQELFDLSGLASLVVVCPSREAAIAQVARER
jgi:anti-anti-sigma factor